MIRSSVEAGGTVTGPAARPAPGTLDLLILKALSLEPMHGWAISERLHQVSRATLQVPQGSLYPALHGWSAAAGSSGVGRLRQQPQAKFYRLTHAGRKQLEAEATAWERSPGRWGSSSTCESTAPELWAT